MQYTITAIVLDWDVYDSYIYKEVSWSQTLYLWLKHFHNIIC